MYKIKWQAKLKKHLVLVLSISLTACLSFEMKPAERFAYLARLQQDLRAVANEVLPVVVTITVNDIEQKQNPWDYFFEDPENEGGKRNPKNFEEIGIGSGVILERRGNIYYVLTNNHVIAGGKDFTITLADEREYQAKVLGRDELRDLALLSFQTDEDLPVARLGDSDSLKVGDFVIAIGAPFGYRTSVTTGIVSALGRRLDRKSTLANISDFIQTDAGINPGNSGGPLVNLQGEVVGINTWITSPTGGSIGIGFAIPVNNVKRFVTSTITGEKIQPGWLGVSVNRILSPEAELELGIQKRKGAFINSVIKNSPAFKGGLRPGDLIVSVNKKKVFDESHLIQIINDLSIDEEISVAVLRLQEEKTFKVKVEGRPPEKMINELARHSWPGLIALPLTKENRERYKIAESEKGLVLVQVDSGTPAFIAGFRVGDVLLTINQHEIKNMLDFYRALNEEGWPALEFVVKRSKNIETITLNY